MIEWTFMTANNDSLTQAAKSAAVLAIAMIFSQICGLLSKSIIGAFFGASAEVDCYMASNRLTETIFNLMAGGALASAFVPAFSALLDKDEKKDAWLLASHVANLLTFVLMIICVLGFIFAPQIVKYILVPGFSLNKPELQAETVKLLRIQLPSVLIFGLSGLMMGVLNANQHFFFPGIAPAMYQVGILLGVVLLSPKFGVEGLAMGAVLGSLLHFLIQLPQLLMIKGKTYSFSLGLKDKSVRDIIKLMIPRQIGASAVQLNFLVNNYLASYLAEGSISAITWGLSLMLLPEAAIAQSTATVALPMFSVQVARGKISEMRSALASVLRFVILLAIPASVGLIILSRPIVQVVFQRRAFTPEMTDMVAWALVWYSAGLIGHCVVEVVSRAFYAMQDTKTPVFILFVSMALNMLMSLGLTRLFGTLGVMPHGGLALANSIATGLEMCALLFFMRRKLSGLDGKRIWDAALKGLISAAVMVVLVGIWLKISSGCTVLIVVLVGALIGVASYMIMMVIFKMEEVSLVKKMLKR